MATDMIFTIEAANVEAAQKWIAEHPCKLRGKRVRAAIGGKITYSFTNTSVGQMQNIKCACGASTCINADDL